MFRAVAMSCILASICFSVEAKEYEEFKPALIEAIDAPDGKVRGTLVGRGAEVIANTTKSSSPVELEVSTIRSFKQAGCKQFEIVLRQQNVPTTDGRMGIFQPTYRMNMCRDGSPPLEGMDVDRVMQFIKSQPKAD